MVKINSASLAEASTLASQIETLQAQLDGFNTQAQDVSKQLVPLQSRFNSLIGSLSPNHKVSKSTRGRGKFTPEQRAAISAGLKAKWAERKAAKAAAIAGVDTVPISA